MYTFGHKTHTHTPHISHPSMIYKLTTKETENVIPLIQKIDMDMISTKILKINSPSITSPLKR